MLKSIPYALASTLVFAGSAFAGEIGVSNTYGHSFRSGTGTTNIEWKTNSQVAEQTSYGAIKVERISAGGENNGWGNGDDDAPGNSGPRNNAENGGGQLPPGLAGGYNTNGFAGSLVFGTRNYTEDTKVSGSTLENYSFGSSTFSHSVGAFAR